MANYSIAQILAMEPRVRNSPADVHPIDGSHRCLEPMRRGVFPGLAGLGGLGGAVSGMELAGGGARCQEEEHKEVSKCCESEFIRVL